MKDDKRFWRIEPLTLIQAAVFGLLVGGLGIVALANGEAILGPVLMVLGFLLCLVSVRRFRRH